ncbi:MAG: repeat-containing protein [Myxococcaceae bacterium]|nr:repeat-containing protein [Myxococcaceae bacterium]
MQTRQPYARAVVMPLVLVLALSIAYAPVFEAGFLNYDDPWLLLGNPFLSRNSPILPTLVAMATDLSRETRLALGAEYLPLRDVLVLLETRVFGMEPEPMHSLSFGLYVSAILLFRGAMLRSLGATWAVEFAVLLFALHPVHVESVAWLAGQKDVLALLFLSAALYVHARGLPRARVLTLLLFALACLSKSMSVAAIGLLAAQDFVQSRRLDRGLYAGLTLLALLVVLVHLHVGSLVHMVAAPAGGTRYTALLTMGPVWLRYLALCLFPTHLSVVYDVPDVTSWNAAVSAGYALVLGALALACWQARAARPSPSMATKGVRAGRLGSYAFVWFFAPLLPVSQVLFPLENRMADRYLWLSVWAPCLLLAYGLRRLAERFVKNVPERASWLFGLPLVLVACMLTFERSLVFGDSVMLFSDATLKTRRSGIGPYQLGKALEEQARDEEAERAFEEVLRRTEQTPALPIARQATNNYARLLARHGQLDAAERTLRSSLRHFPGDPKLTRNLAKVLRARGELVAADALESDLSLPARR